MSSEQSYTIDGEPTQQFTTRIVRKRRRIIRKVVIIDGVERVTEEVIEEPDEVDEQTSQIPSGPGFDGAWQEEVPAIESVKEATVDSSIEVSPEDVKEASQEPKKKPVPAKRSIQKTVDERSPEPVKVASQEQIEEPVQEQPTQVASKDLLPEQVFADTHEPAEAVALQPEPENEESLQIRVQWEQLRAMEVGLKNYLKEVQAELRDLDPSNSSARDELQSIMDSFSKHEHLKSDIYSLANELMLADPSSTKPLQDITQNCDTEWNKVVAELNSVVDTLNNMKIPETEVEVPLETVTQPEEVKLPLETQEQVKVEETTQQAAPLEHTATVVPDDIKPEDDEGTDSKKRKKKKAKGKKLPSQASSLEKEPSPPKSLEETAHDIESPIVKSEQEVTEHIPEEKIRTDIQIESVEIPKQDVIEKSADSSVEPATSPSDTVPTSEEKDKLDTQWKNLKAMESDLKNYLKEIQAELNNLQVEHAPASDLENLRNDIQSIIDQFSKHEHHKDNIHKLANELIIIDPNNATTLQGINENADSEWNKVNAELNDNLETLNKKIKEAEVLSEVAPSPLESLDSVEAEKPDGQVLPKEQVKDVAQDIEPEDGTESKKRKKKKPKSKKLVGVGSSFEKEPSPVKEDIPEPVEEVSPELGKTSTQEIIPEPVKETTQEMPEELSPEPVKEIAQEVTKELSPEPVKEIAQEVTKELSPIPAKEITEEVTEQLSLEEITQDLTEEISPEEVSLEPVKETTQVSEPEKLELQIFIEWQELKAMEVGLKNYLKEVQAELRDLDPSNSSARGDLQSIIDQFSKHEHLKINIQTLANELIFMDPSNVTTLLDIIKDSDTEWDRVQRELTNSWSNIPEVVETKEVVPETTFKHVKEAPQEQRQELSLEPIEDVTPAQSTEDTSTPVPVKEEISPEVPKSTKEKPQLEKVDTETPSKEAPSEPTVETVVSPTIESAPEPLAESLEPEKIQDATEKAVPIETPTKTVLDDVEPEDGTDPKKRRKKKPKSKKLASGGSSVEKEPSPPKSFEDVQPPVVQKVQDVPVEMPTEKIVQDIPLTSEEIPSQKSVADEDAKQTEAIEKIEKLEANCRKLKDMESDLKNYLKEVQAELQNLIIDPTTNAHDDLQSIIDQFARHEHLKSNIHALVNELMITDPKNASPELQGISKDSDTEWDKVQKELNDSWEILNTKVTEIEAVKEPKEEAKESGESVKLDVPVESSIETSVAQPVEKDEEIRAASAEAVEKPSLETREQGKIEVEDATEQAVPTKVVLDDVEPEDNSDPKKRRKKKPKSKKLPSGQSSVEKEPSLPKSLEEVAYDIESPIVKSEQGVTEQVTEEKEPSPPKSPEESKPTEEKQVSFEETVPLNVPEQTQEETVKPEITLQPDKEVVGEDELPEQIESKDITDPLIKPTEELLDTRWDQLKPLESDLKNYLKEVQAELIDLRVEQAPSSALEKLRTDLQSIIEQFAKHDHLKTSIHKLANELTPTDPNSVATLQDSIKNSDAEWEKVQTELNDSMAILNRRIVESETEAPTEVKKLVTEGTESVEVPKESLIDFLEEESIKKKSKRSRKKKGKQTTDVDPDESVASPEESLQSTKDVQEEVIALSPEDSEPPPKITDIQEQQVSMPVQPAPEEHHMDVLSTLQNQIEASLNQPQVLEMTTPEDESLSLSTTETSINDLNQRLVQRREVVITEWVEIIEIVTVIYERIRYITKQINESSLTPEEKRVQYENLNQQVKSLNSILDNLEKVEGEDGQPLQGPLNDKIREVLNSTRSKSDVVQQIINEGQEALPIEGSTDVLEVEKQIESPEEESKKKAKRSRKKKGKPSADGISKESSTSREPSFEIVEDLEQKEVTQTQSSEPQSSTTEPSDSVSIEEPLSSSAMVSQYMESFPETDHDDHHKVVKKQLKPESFMEGEGEDQDERQPTFIAAEDYEPFAPAGGIMISQHITTERRDLPAVVMQNTDEVTSQEMSEITTVTTQIDESQKEHESLIEEIEFAQDEEPALVVESSEEIQTETDTSIPVEEPESAPVPSFIVGSITSQDAETTAKLETFDVSTSTIPVESKDSEVSAVLETSDKSSSPIAIEVKDSDVSATPETVERSSSTLAVHVKDSDVSAIPEPLERPDSIPPVQVKVKDSDVSATPETVERSSSTLPLHVKESDVSATPETLERSSSTLPVEVKDSDVSATPVTLERSSSTLPVEVKDIEVTIAPETGESSSLTLPIETKDSQVSVTPETFESSTSTVPIEVKDSYTSAAPETLDISTATHTPDSTQNIHVQVSPETFEASTSSLPIESLDKQVTAGPESIEASTSPIPKDSKDTPVSAVPQVFDVATSPPPQPETRDMDTSVVQKESIVPEDKVSQDVPEKSIVQTSEIETNTEPVTTFETATSPPPQEPTIVEVATKPESVEVATSPLESLEPDDGTDPKKRRKKKPKGKKLQSSGSSSTEKEPSLPDETEALRMQWEKLQVLESDLKNYLKEVQAELRDLDLTKTSARDELQSIIDQFGKHEHLKKNIHILANELKVTDPNNVTKLQAIIENSDTEWDRVQRELTDSWSKIPEVVEKEEVSLVPDIEISSEQSHAIVAEPTQQIHTRLIRKRRRIIRKVENVDGVERVTEEVIEEPDEVDEQTRQISGGQGFDYVRETGQAEASAIESVKETTQEQEEPTQQITTRTIRKRRRIIRKVEIIDGVERVTEQVIEEPDEVDEQTSSAGPVSGVWQEEVPTIESLKGATIVSGTELSPWDVKEATQEQTEERMQEEPTQQFTTRTVRKRRRIIRKVEIIDGVERVTEEVIEEPDEVDEQTSQISIAPGFDDDWQGEVPAIESVKEATIDSSIEISPEDVKEASQVSKEKPRPAKRTIQKTVDERSPEPVKEASQEQKVEPSLEPVQEQPTQLPSKELIPEQVLVDTPEPAEVVALQPEPENEEALQIRVQWEQLRAMESDLKNYLKEIQAELRDLDPTNSTSRNDLQSIMEQFVKNEHLKTNIRSIASELMNTDPENAKSLHNIVDNSDAEWDKVQAELNNSLEIVNKMAETEEQVKDSIPEPEGGEAEAIEEELIDSPTEESSKKKSKKQRKKKGKQPTPDTDESISISSPNDSLQSTEDVQEQKITLSPEDQEPQYYITESSENIQEQEVSLSVQPAPEELHMDALSTLQNQIERSLNQPKGSQALMIITPSEDESLSSIESRINDLNQRLPSQERVLIITEWVEYITIVTEVYETIRYITQRIDHSPLSADGKRPQYENLNQQVKSLNSILDNLEKVEGDDGQPLQSPLKEKIREVLNSTRSQSALVQQFLTDSQEALTTTVPDSAETKWESESLSRQESLSSSDQASESPPVQATPSVHPLSKQGKKKKGKKEKKVEVEEPVKEISEPVAVKSKAIEEEAEPPGFNIKIGSDKDHQQGIIPQPDEGLQPVTVSVEPPTPESQIQYVVKISSPNVPPDQVEKVEQMRQFKSPDVTTRRGSASAEEGISITLGPTESVLLTSESADESNITVVPVTHTPSAVEEPSEQAPPGKTHRVKKEKKKVTFEKSPEARPVPIIEITGPSGQELELLAKVVNFKQELQKVLGSKPSTLLSGNVENVTVELRSVKDKVKNLQQKVSAKSEEYMFVEEILTIIESLTIIIQTLRRQSADLKDANLPVTEKIEVQGDVQEKLKSLEKTIDVVKSNLDEYKMNPEVKDHLYDILSGIGSLNHQADEILTDNSDSLKKCLEEYQKLVEMIENDKKILNAFVDRILVVSEDPRISPSQKLTQVDGMEPEFHKMKHDIYDRSEVIYRWCDENPTVAQPLQQQLSDLNVQMINTEAFLNEEKDRLVQIISLAEEYEQTLQEFSQVIEVAEALVEEKLAVRNLQHLQDELHRNRNFFGNLKRCQQALEKLEYDLDVSTREAHKDLHQRLYNQATSILERAAKRRQQMAVASARWGRLEQGLNEEGNWLASTSKKIPSLKSVASTDCERYCGIYQGLYSDVIVHQARLMQLRTVSESLLSTVACGELEGKTDSLVEDLLHISNRITSGLQSLVGFRDAFSNYERLIHRLKSWLQKAEAKMDAIALQPQSHPYDFWELKAQLESQQPLKNEAATLLDQALRVLSVTDEPNIRDNFANFEDRWLALSSVISQTEMGTYQGEDSPAVSLAARLNSIGKDVNEIKDTLEGMNLTVETEDDLYCYLEKLQILKAQILNKKHQLNTIKRDTTLEPKDAEKIGALLAGLSAIDVQVTEELETAHVIREKFATFGRMALKTRRLQDTLRARVDQWASFFELSQDILKQALQNCQSLDEDITTNHVDLEKMHQVLSSFPSSGHLSLSTGKMEHELNDMEATVHTLTARVQDLRKRVQEQLGFWQDYEHALNTVAQLLHHSQSTLDLVDNEPPASLHALNISERYLNNVEEALKEKSSVLQSLQSHAEKLKAESPEDVQKQIEETVENIRSDWKGLEERLSRAKSKYSRAKESWNVVLRLKTDISEWIRLIYPHVELGSPARDVVERLQNELPLYEERMSELDKAASELCVTLFHPDQMPTGTSTEQVVSSVVDGVGDGDNKSTVAARQLPLTIELEVLSRKLLFLRNYLSAAAPSGGGSGGRKPEELLEQTKATFSSASAGIQSEEEPSADRLSVIYEHLLSLGNAEGRMKAAQSCSPVPDSHLAELLQSSRKIFQQTFVEYLRVWKSLSERESVHEVFSIWENYLIQCQNYLGEPIPSSREQLIEDESLCKVYQTILNGQHSSMSPEEGQLPPTSRDPVDFPALEKRYWDIETQLVGRQREIETRLGAWKNYLTSQDSFAAWLRTMEREKRSLELPFLQLKRLSATTAKIELLIEKCPRGEELLEDLKTAKSALLPFASPELRASLVQDLSSNNSRYQNIQAALRTWLDHTNRLSDMNDTFQHKSNRIAQTLSDLSDRLAEEKVPTTFSHMKKYITKLEKIEKEVQDVSPLFEEVRTCLEDMKSSISPADARLLSQKVWFLTQQHVELLSTIAQNKSDAEEKVDRIPAFDTKCKNWLLWAKCMQEKLARTQYLTLDDYSKWLVKEAEPEIASKEDSYEWIMTNGKTLAEMTGGNEKKELLSAVKQVKQLWQSLNETSKQRIAKVTHLQEMLTQLNSRYEESLCKLKGLEKFVIAPVTFQELSSEEINKVLHSHEGERKKLNGESCDVNQILNLGEVAATDCDDLKMYQDAFKVRQQCENVDESWKQLIARFNKRKEALNQLVEKSQKIEEGCDFVEALLSQADSDLTRLENSDASESSEINRIVSEAQGLQESLRALSPKIEDIGNEYCFIAKQVNVKAPGKLSQRVKKVIQDWRLYIERSTAVISTCHRKLLLSNFSICSIATEEYIQLMISKANTAIQELPSDHDTAMEKLNCLKTELRELQGLETEMQDTGKSLTSNDRTAEPFVDEKTLAYNLLKRSLDEKLSLLAESISKIQQHQKLQQQQQKQEEEKGVQVETLTKKAVQRLSAAAAPSEKNKSVQVETLFKQQPVTASDASSSSTDGLTTTQSEIDGDTITLTRVDIYLQELMKAISDSEESMTLLENLVSSDEVETDSYDSLVRALANTQSMVDHVRHLYQLLVEEHKVSNDIARGPEVEQLQARLRAVEEKARAYGQKLRESSPATKEVTCPVCTPSQRGAWDSTLWRLEQWLNHAEAKLKTVTKKRPPTSLEQLEDAILKHRELVLDLDSHRSLVFALTGVLTHLSKHGETRTMGQVELDKLRDRLRKALEAWKKICHKAAAWQARLQIALIENPDFHVTITQYEEALNTIQETIHRLEPVDLNQSRKIVVSKLRKFTELKESLLRMEPELATLLQTAEQLFTNATAIEKEGTFRPTIGSSERDIFITPECSVVLDRISDLNHRLKSLQKVCDAYVKHLSMFLQRAEEEPTEEEASSTAALLSFSDQIIEQSGRSSSALARSASPQPSNSSNEREVRDGSVIIRSGRYIMRVVRASIPIQAMILLLLGAASLIPYGEQDFLCSARNTLQSSLEPMLHYPDGPPPI